MAEQIQNGWGKVFLNAEALPKDKFIVLHGNEENGMAYTKDELIKNYRSNLRHCFSQDMSIYFNGKLIRSVRNFNATVLGKTVSWGLSSKFIKTQYIKYNIK